MAHPQPKEIMNEAAQKIKSILAEHYGAFIIAALFGLLLAGPFILVRAEQSFRGVYPELANDQNFYLSRIQDVRDGFPESGNTYLAEHKDAPQMQFLTGEIIEAKILDLLSLPTSAGLILFPLLCAPLIFLLTYAIFLSLGTPKFFAILGAGVLCFGIYFFAFARPISPQFNFIFWLAAVWGLCSLRENSSYAWILINAFLVGILFYLYPYYWTHLALAYGLLFLWYVYANRRKALGIFGVLVGAGLIAIPYFQLLLTARTLPYYQESLARVGFVQTHSPSGLYLAFLSTLVLGVVFFLLWKKNAFTRTLLPVGALLAGALVAMNQHILTGINMEFSSHYGMQIVFANFFLLSATLGVLNWWSKLSRKTLAGIGILVILGLVPIISAPYVHAKKLFEADALYAKQATLIEWLNGNTKPGDVVYASKYLALAIPAYTRTNVFSARNATISFMPNSEVIDRTVIQHYRAEFTDQFIRDNERELFGHYYINRYDHTLQKQKFLSLFGLKTALPERIPEDTLSHVKARAKELQSKTFAELIKNYRIDYFIIDNGDTDEPTSEDMSFATLVFETDAFKVYKNSR